MSLIHRLVFSLFMSLALSIPMSGWVTWLNLGLHPDFLRYWGQAFLAAWPAAAFISFLLGPQVQRLTGLVVQRVQ